MASTRFYLDERRATSDNPGILKVAIGHKGSTALVSLDVKLFPKQWDSKKLRVVNHPDQMVVNVHIARVKQQIDSIILNLANEGRLSEMKTAELKNYILDQLDPERAAKQQEAERKQKSFAYRLLKFADTHEKASTRGVYMQTYRRLVAYLGDKLDNLTFEEMTKEWLIKFEAFLAQTASKNARNIHLRNIRAVFNEALDDEITTCYPFRRFSIKPEKTRKRNLKVDDLRKLFSYPCEEYAVKYLDMFKLMFMLIGINAVDLCHLKGIDSDGRITFHRSKTNRLYSIKVEPEALEIINKYLGNKWLLNILDGYKNHQDFLKKMNNALKKIGKVTRKGRGGKKTIEPLFPEISSYWARHSWATIAASLDIPRDTIAHALGHGSDTVTDIYIEFDESKVDEANRRVIDWVLYGKR